jgi:hypothetical protein
MAEQQPRIELGRFNASGPEHTRRLRECLSSRSRFIGHIK